MSSMCVREGDILSHSGCPVGAERQADGCIHAPPHPQVNIWPQETKVSVCVCGQSLTMRDCRGLRMRMAIGGEGGGAAA